MRIVEVNAGKGRKYRGHLGYLTVNGPTIRDVKKQLIETAEEALSETGIPAGFGTPGHVGVTWWDPLGRWSYGYLSRQEIAAGARFEFRAITVGYPSRLEAEMAVRRHLAQNEWDPTCPAEAEAIIHPEDARGLEQHRQWVGWQLRYQEARRAGKTDQEAFNYAWRR
jgi:hypothetical protein